MVIVVNPVHLSNAPVPMFVTKSEIVKEVKPVQLKKAPLPILVILFGSEIPVIAAKLVKPLLAM